MERVLSVAIVGLIAGIGVTVWIQGKHFDPNRFALRADALKSTTAAVEGKASTARSGVTRSEESVARKPAESSAVAEPGEESGAAGEHMAASSPAVPAKGEPLEVQVAGLKPMSATEFYAPDNLFEKIDGRAPAYLGFNFQQLRSRSFSVAGADGSYVDVFEYRFDTPINAFGMFALERDPQGRPLDFAPDGYSGEMGFFFRQGARYVQIIASDQKPKTMELAKALAQDRAKALPADNAGLDARRRLPATGLVPESVSFVQDNAQGQAFLKNVFQADYQFAGKKLPFFLMLATPEDAAAAWKAFQDFAGKFGGKVTVLPEVNRAKVFQAENFGTWKVIYQRDGEIGGVYDAADGDKARQFVEQYLQGKIQ